MGLIKAHFSPNHAIIKAQMLIVRNLERNHSVSLPPLSFRDFVKLAPDPSR